MTGTLPIVRACLDADVPVLLWGPPGVGKTCALRQMATDAGAHLEVLIGSTLDPIDVGGYLVPGKGGKIRSTPPPWTYRIRKALDAKRPAWLLLDELSCAPPSVQAALLRVVAERRAGEIDLAGCRVVAASNPADTAADGGELSAAMANRWAHVTWQVDAAAWVSGTLRAWGQGHPTARAAEIAASIAAFVQRHPASLLAVPPNLAAAGRAWPSPRSWTYAIAAGSTGPDDLLRSVVASLVGDGAAQEWHEYHLARDLPDPEDLLTGRAPMPTRGDLVSAALSSVAAAAAAVHEDRNRRLEAAWRLVINTRADLGVIAARTLLDASDSVPSISADYSRRLRNGGLL